MSSKDTKKRAPNPLVQFYLFAYNAAQFGAWAWCLYHIVTLYLNGVKPVLDLCSIESIATLPDAWKRIGHVQTLCQNAAILEVVHSLIGFVRSPVATTAMQVASRLLLVNLVAQLPSAQSLYISQMMLACWGLIEVIRYAFYAINIYTTVPYPLLWLRYSVFLFDYPGGVAGEMGTIWYSLDAIKKSGLWSIRMPNAWNFAFDAHLFFQVLLVVYLWGLPTMYGHMLKLRKKNLGGEKSEEKKKKA